jgi:DNA-binding CsgD family transcriptional regulator
MKGSLLEAYWKSIQKYRNIILIFGVAYSCVIGFSLFGPLVKVYDARQIFSVSVTSLVAFIVSFIMPRNLLRFKWPMPIGIAMAAILGVAGYYISSPLLCLLAVGIYAFVVATICRSWTFFVYREIPGTLTGAVMSGAFFIAFSILYCLNISYMILTPLTAFAIAILLLLAAYLMAKRTFSEIAVQPPGLKQIWHQGLFLFIVYICGGISYAGIYPFLDAYQHIDRFYNVLPLVVCLPLAGYLTIRFQKAHVFVIGVSLLGIAFSFFALGISLTKYFFIQTFLQMGWAFLNVFGFTFAWDESKRLQIPGAFGTQIIFILMGVMTGAVLAQWFNAQGFAIAVYAVTTLVPLFVCLGYFIMMTVKPRVEEEMTLAVFSKLPILDMLTDREKEVAYYYFFDESAPSIADRLHISLNTVKTHLKKVYLKLEVSSKDEFKEKIKCFVLKS